MKRCALALIGSLWWPAAAPAVDLEFSAAARQSVEISEPIQELRLPASRWRQDGPTAVTVVGEVRHRVWQIPGADLTTLQLQQRIETQLVAQGFSIVFDCETRSCGGFEFRYAIPVVSGPEMHVDLGDYRYLLARRTSAGQKKYVAVLISRSASQAFIQVSQILGTGEAAVIEDTGTAREADPDIEAPPSNLPLAEHLRQTGRAVLADLTFQIGSSALQEAQFASLATLAAFLTEDPDTRIVLVGHTDTDGTLANNIALSRKRAEAVRERLISAYGAPADRIEAEGVGYLAPLASNATDAGRTRNRRVEAVLSETP